MIFLLDVNVLIALLDQEHVHCQAARDWFGGLDDAGWATCPLTQNGVIRIMGNRNYPGAAGTPAQVAGFLTKLIARGGHIFWADSVSLLDSAIVAPDRLLTSAQITDTYLLALAKAHGGRLATFDRRLVADAVPGGKAHIALI